MGRHVLGAPAIHDPLSGVGGGWGMHFFGGESVLTKLHLQHGFHVHGCLLGIVAFFVVVVASTVVAMLVVVVVWRIAPRAFGRLMAFFLASRAIVGRLEVATCAIVSLFATHFA